MSFLDHFLIKKYFPERGEEIIWDTESSSASDLQPPSPIEFQISDEGFEVYNLIRVAAFLSQENLVRINTPTN